MRIGHLLVGNLIDFPSSVKVSSKRPKRIHEKYRRKNCLNAFMYMPGQKIIPKIIPKGPKKSPKKVPKIELCPNVY